jgi:hypothetical protein
MTMAMAMVWPSKYSDVATPGTMAHHISSRSSFKDAKNTIKLKILDEFRKLTTQQ